MKTSFRLPRNKGTTDGNVTNQSSFIIPKKMKQAVQILADDAGLVKWKKCLYCDRWLPAYSVADFCTQRTRKCQANFLKRTSGTYTWRGVKRV
jgi:hypothetical protein